jgi:peptidoglycan/LPS O-acetylase OafA/YrhL
MSHKASRLRVEVLDPLRGLAALAVAWYHFTNCSGLVQTAWLRASGAYGWLGVDMFFVVSGFVIPYSMYRGAYQPTRDFGRFLAKRMIRLEPPYLVSIGIALALLGVASLTGHGGEKPPISAPQLLLHLGYLNTFFGYRWLNEVYWTLGIEFQYYLFVALAYPLLVVKSHRLRLVGVAALAGVSLLFHSPTLVFHFLGLFSLGILAFHYHAGLMSGRTFLAGLAAVAVLTTLGLNSQIASVGCATALLIAFVPMPRHAAAGPLVFLGRISYSLYLLHTMIGGPLVNLGARFGSGLAWELVVLAVATAASVAAAVGLHRLVERPAQELSSRIKYSPGRVLVVGTNEVEARVPVRPRPDDSLLGRGAAVEVTP